MSDEERREGSGGSADGRLQHHVPYLHVRAPKRVVGVGGEPREPERPDYSRMP
jgi:hypothetical protein